MNNDICKLILMLVFTCIVSKFFNVLEKLEFHLAIFFPTHHISSFSWRELTQKIHSKYLQMIHILLSFQDVNLEPYGIPMELLNNSKFFKIS